MKKHRLLTISITLFLIFLSSGCATYGRDAPPKSTYSELSIEVNSKTISPAMDYLPGVYKINDSRTVITGHQGNSFAGALFGPIGVLAQGAINAEKGKERVEDIESLLVIDLNEITERHLNSLIDTNQFEIIISKEKGSRLKLTTGLILQYNGTHEIIPYTLVKVQMKKNGQEVWSEKYFASSGSPKKLSGSDSWTNNDSNDLTQNVEKSLTKSISFLLKDIFSPFERKNVKKFKGYLPFVKKNLEFKAALLYEDEDHYYVAAKQSPLSVSLGIQILSKDLTEILD